jgi:hypothetical protein
LLLSGLAPAKAELLVNISKLQQQAVVVIDGAENYRWPVSTGVRGHETPAGGFHPIRLERHWYSRQYSLTPMPWSMYFYRGHAMHGTMEAYNLGHAASHGCVRLRPDNAAILYSLVRRHGMRNTKVVMDGPLPGAPGAAPMADAEMPPANAVAEQHFAKAVGDEADDYAAKTHRASGPAQENGKDDEKVDVGKHGKTRLAGAVAYRVSASSDERQVLREREAWLRSLDRKYGITR